MVQFPYPRQYTDLETGLKVSFSYSRQEESKRLFYATTTTDNDNICIKFTLRYSKEAHEEAYKAGYAPKLLGFEQVGDWNMIVMDDVSESHLTLHDLASDPSSSADYNISTNLRGAIDTLHARGFVHGDIRDVNVLVRRMDQMDLSSVRDHPDDNDVSMESDRQADILLVDFDWAGREGDVQYPHNVNPDITRSPGAVSGAVILASHDIWLYEHLVSSMVG